MLLLFGVFLLRRDSIEFDDYVGLSLDLSGKLLTTYEFYVSASGVQADWVRNRVDDSRSRDWDADWQSAASIGDFLRQWGEFCLIVLAMMIVMIAGGIDLSVGSLIALSSVVASVLIRDYGGGMDAGAGSMLLFSLVVVWATAMPCSCASTGAFT